MWATSGPRVRFYPVRADLERADHGHEQARAAALALPEDYPPVTRRRRPQCCSGNCSRRSAPGSRSAWATLAAGQSVSLPASATEHSRNPRCPRISCRWHSAVGAPGPVVPAEVCRLALRLLRDVLDHLGRELAPPLWEPSVPGVELEDQGEAQGSVKITVCAVRRCHSSGGERPSPPSCRSRAV